MNTTREVTLLDNAQVKMRITVPGDEVRREHDAIVQEYCEHAHLKGFRKGKVPADVMIRKLGPSLADQTRAQVLEKAVEEAFENAEQKPFPYANPEVKADDPVEPGKDWTFEVTYDTFPVVELGPYTGLEVEEPSWQVDDEDIGRELKSVQEQNALFTDKEPAVVAKGDIANIDYVEVEAGAEKPATPAAGVRVRGRHGLQLLPHRRRDRRHGEGRDPGPHEGLRRGRGEQGPRGPQRDAARHGQLREGEEAARAERRARPGHQREVQDPRRPEGRHPGEARGRREGDAALGGHQHGARPVVESSKIPLPRSLVEYQLDSMWRDYVRETRIDEARLVELLREQGRDPAAMRAEMTPAAEQRARLQLVISEISKREQIGVEEAEIEAEIGRLAEARRVEAKDLRENLTKNDLHRHPRGQPAPGEALRPHPVEDRS